MRAVLAITLAVILGATATLISPGASRPAMMAARFGGSAVEEGGGAATEASARRWKLARKRLGTMGSTSRRRASAGRGRFMATWRRRPSSLERSDGNLPPNIGIGIGTGF